MCAIMELEKNADVHFGILTVRGCMDTFGIRSRKTIVNACLMGKVVAEKADADEGERGGVWLIDAKSAYNRWDKSKGKR